MPVKPTYPGVYIQEIPSGVRTITGVSTSIALFIGRSRRGPMNKPILCLSFSDFVRTFSIDSSLGDLARSVRLFFENGGNQCYVMRIANGAEPAKVNLKSESGGPGPNVLTLTAKDAGLIGETIRAAVTYSGPQPEATFSLELFRWETGAGGQLVKQDQEIWTNLSMNPLSPRYAPIFLTQNSSLVDAALAAGAPAPAANGFSQSGRPVQYTAATPTTLRTAWAALLGNAGGVTTNRFEISVGGSPFVLVDLASINVGVLTATSVAAFEGALAPEIQTRINTALPAGKTVIVSFPAGPAPGVAGDATDVLRIESAGNDVFIRAPPATTWPFP